MNGQMLFINHQKITELILIPFVHLSDRRWDHMTHSLIYSLTLLISWL